MQRDIAGAACTEGRCNQPSGSSSSLPSSPLACKSPQQSPSQTSLSSLSSSETSPSHEHGHQVMPPPLVTTAVAAKPMTLLCDTAFLMRCLHVFPTQENCLCKALLTQESCCCHDPGIKSKCIVPQLRLSSNQVSLYQESMCIYT